MTAAELIQQRADSEQPNMGLTTWQKTEIRKTDVTIAKNYLREDEILQLNRIVVMWLDFAEARRKDKELIGQKDSIKQLEELSKKCSGILNKKIDIE
jgi:hypothetical protein